jgi:hypothetical protein
VFFGCPWIESAVRSCRSDSHHRLNKCLAVRDNERMVKSVEGIYRNGKVELSEPLTEAEGSRVIVTWVNPAVPVDLCERGIDESQAATPASALVCRRLGPAGNGSLR